MVAVNLYAKCHQDFAIRKVKVTSRCSHWASERKHLGTLFSKISHAMIEHDNQTIRVNLFGSFVLVACMRYLLLLEKVVDKLLLLFYKGKDFAADLVESPLPIVLSTQWSYQDYGDAILYLICDGCSDYTTCSNMDDVHDVHGFDLVVYYEEELFKLMFLKYLLLCMRNLQPANSIVT